MGFPEREVVEKLRKKYRAGMRVELVNPMNDEYHKLPAGLRGTVEGVDDIGNILVHWDNGSGLNVVYGVDTVKKLKNEAFCPVCRKIYNGRPAISRDDNKTKICPECGTRQALNVYRSYMKSQAK